MVFKLNQYKRPVSLIFVILISCSVSAKVIYVDAGGQNTDGSDWANAYRYLQDALGAAQQGDEVRVAQGIYIPDRNTTDPNGTGDRYSSFEVGSGVILRGGYAGLSYPPDPNDQDPSKYETILSGERYFFHVLTARDNSLQSNIESLTVIKGKADSSDLGHPRDGGGLYCENSSLLIKGCIFDNNEGLYSGAIYCGYSTVRFENCQFIGNRSKGSGGAVYLYYTSFDFINCLFQRNVTESSGAIYGYCPESESPATIYNCSFLENYAASYAGIIYKGIELNIINCTFSKNHITKPSGIVFADSSYYDDTCCLNVTNSIFWDNHTPDNTQISSSVSSTDMRIVNVRYSNIEFGKKSIKTGYNKIINWGNDNFNINPLLTWDGHLEASSPCIDKGDPNTNILPVFKDCDSEPRICGDYVDIGVDEFIDIDKDYLPDWWENYYFNGLTVYDANDNPDQDNWLNSIEYKQGSDPLYKGSDYFVDPAKGDDVWDGLAPEWDGEHGPKATIQQAINQAGFREGDRVFLKPGVYQGMGNRDLDFGGRSLYLSCMNPYDPNCIAHTLIDCQGDPNEPHRAFIFHNNEGIEAVVDGLTIINGYAESGGGVYCSWGSRPTFKRCVFKENEAVHGGGIYGCAGKIVDCVIADNKASFYGGGICNSSGMIVNSSIHGNSAAVGGGVANGVCQIVNCLIEENVASMSGGGLYLQEGGTVVNSFINNNHAWQVGGIVFKRSSIHNCTITGNQSEHSPAGMHTMYYSSDDPPTVVNSICWGNLAEDRLPEYSQTDQFIGNQYANCCIQGWTAIKGGINIIAVDPQLTNKYHLANDSPCLDAGANAYLSNDIADLDNDANFIESVPFDIEGNSRCTDNPHAVNPVNSDVPVVDIGCYEVLSQGLYMDKTEADVSESGVCSFYVSLAMQPAAPIDVIIQQISGPDTIVLQTAETISFTPDDYSNPQEIVIRADEDNNYMNDDAEFTLSLVDLHTVHIRIHEIDSNPDPDFNDDGRVNNDDLNMLISHWLQASPAFDVAPVGGDGIVSVLDFAELAKLWVPYASGFSDGFESGDFTQSMWTLSGSQPWQINTSMVLEGLYAAKSGNISDYQNSALTLEINSNYNQISFYYKVSSEEGYDYLKFYIDGDLQGQWSGEIPWTRHIYSISEGNHIFQWMYSKDEIVSSGYDSAWIDDVELLYSK